MIQLVLMLRLIALMCISLSRSQICNLVFRQLLTSSAKSVGAVVKPVLGLVQSLAAIVGALELRIFCLVAQESLVALEARIRNPEATILAVKTATQRCSNVGLPAG